VLFQYQGVCDRPDVESVRLGWVIPLILVHSRWVLVQRLQRRRANSVTSVVLIGRHIINNAHVLFLSVSWYVSHGHALPHSWQAGWSPMMLGTGTRCSDGWCNALTRAAKSGSVMVHPSFVVSM